MGRINFGAEMADRKGLVAPVRLGGAALAGWQVFRLPLDGPMIAGLRFRDAAGWSGPAFWRAPFDLERPGDTFLDMRSWGKGVVWVNGRCLGRYWNVGPTQTAYAPGCWLHAGRNEVVILDLTGPADPVVAGLPVPILDQLRPGLDFAQPGAPAGAPGAQSSSQTSL
jgi:beta-galactosidase